MLRPTSPPTLFAVIYSENTNQIVKLITQLVIKLINTNF